MRQNVDHARKVGRKQLRQPVHLGCHQLVIAMLDNASAACERMLSSNDPEALHDFRVGVRRLLACLRAYRPYLVGVPVRKRSKQLRRLISDTNADRDRQVHVAWLQRELSRHRQDGRPRKGLQHLLSERLVEKPAEAPTFEVVSSNFGRFHAKLGKELDSDASRRGTDQDGLSYGHAAANILRRHTVVLRHRLGSILSMDDQESAHLARLTAKRMRYVLEPIAKLLDGGRGIVGELKKLQDRLGDLHDLQTLEERANARMKEAIAAWSTRLTRVASYERNLSPITHDRVERHLCYALAAASQRVREGERREFAQLESQWLQHAADPFFGRLERLIDQLESTAKTPTPQGGLYETSPRAAAVLRSGSVIS